MYYRLIDVEGKPIGKWIRISSKKFWESKYLPNHLRVKFIELKKGTNPSYKQMEQRQLAWTLYQVEGMTRNLANASQRIQPYETYHKMYSIVKELNDLKHMLKEELKNIK